MVSHISRALVFASIMFMGLGTFVVIQPLRSVEAASIPAGCPGSDRAGPADPAACASIPPGCPGSTQRGPRDPNAACPYDPPARRQNLQADCTDPALDQSKCGIIARVVDFIQILSAIVGIVVVISIAVAGIQYSASRDNPQEMAAAKLRIRNAVLALVLYLFMFAFLQWLVPGGVI